MSTAEAEALLAGSGRICVRMKRAPDGRIVTADRPHEPTIDKGPFAGLSVAALAAFIGLSQATAAAAGVLPGGTPQEQQAPVGTRSVRAGSDSTLSGTVQYWFNHSPLGGARVVAVDETTGEEYTVHASDDGTFVLPVRAGSYTVAVTVEGFFPFGSGGVRVKPGGNAVVRAELNIVPIGEWVTIYPDTPPPRLSTLDPRDGGSAKGSLWQRAFDRLKALFGR
jgi:hypothetical protein